jgi:hypothetical protein
MKLLSILFLFLSAQAFANPFDSFVGEYSIVGKPVIQKSGAAKSCIRFAFEDLVGFSVIADTKGYKQSHMLHFNFDGNLGHGWMGHPVMDFTDQYEYAKTTGDSSFVQNEYSAVEDINFGHQPLVVSIENKGNQYVLIVRDSLIKSSQVLASCFYQAMLVKK